MHIFDGTLGRRRCGKVTRWGAMVWGCALLVLLSGCGRMADGWRRMRGDAMRHAGHHARALGWYEKIATNRQDAAVLQAMAELYAAQGDVTNLQAVSERLCALTEDVETLQAMAEMRQKQEDMEGAAKMLERAISVASNTWDSYAMLIDVYLEAGNSNAAARAVQRAEESLPVTKRTRRQLVGAWMHAGQTSNAITHINALLAADEENHEARLVLAMLQMQEKEYGVAASNLNVIVRAEPEHAIAVASLADALNAMDDVQGAIPMYRRAIRIDQRNAMALNNLAYVLLTHTSNVTEAIELARSSVSIERAAHALDTLGYAYYLRGSDEMAMKYLREAEQMREEHGEEVDAELHLHIGMVHGRRGEKEFAALRIGKALAAQPELEKYVMQYAWYKDVKKVIKNTSTRDGKN